MAWTDQINTHRRGHSTGIIAIIIAVLLLSLSDALVKLWGGQFGLAQLALLRSAVAAPLIAITYGCFFGISSLRMRQARWVWARSLCMAAMWLAYYAALPSMSFALAAACYYTTPVWMALMAWATTGERIEGQGWIAIAASLCGVIMLVGPHEGSLTPSILLPLIAAIFYAMAGTITWRYCQSESAGAMALNLNICLCALSLGGLALLTVIQPKFGSEFVFAIWPRLGLAEVSFAIGLGVLLAVIATLVALAYQLTPSPVVGVFDTAYLGFAAIWGAIWFAETPSLLEGFGIALIGFGAVMMNHSSRGRAAV
ncbi:Threonine/homoserine efflux transporter RhtA [Monaibacterium marinum]|uniref:Threonine/homoserine efflux transporter RhtA n=1 Tax=Pontivivens marinum TaxID=1690039 RepID=A0A2C9CQG5_9RHOB|nr:DMT family transporter [Monaibacterium marinum]SOH93791.1 Threonine/homoserine efflux transporter RhtA [Monaibacterium marinum]